MSRRTDDRGAVTAEAALVLPLLVALTLGLVWVLTLATTQLRLVDAAREAARAAARGDPPAAAVAAGQIASPGATLTLTVASDRVTVRAKQHVSAPGGLFASLVGVDLEAEAVSVVETR